MTVIEAIRLILGSLFIICGVMVFIFEIYGVFHLKYVLNRMHAAAMGDTLGLFLCSVGIMIFSGLNFTTLKLILVVMFFWFSSPVSSHLIAKLVMRTDDKVDKKLSFRGDLSELEKKLSQDKEA